MESLDRDGKIRLSMTIEKDGETGELTIKHRLKNSNEKINGAFIITKEMRDELREPLIFLLMEKSVTPSPIVSLLNIIANHILQGIFAIEELKFQRKSALDGSCNSEKVKSKRNLLLKIAKNHQNGTDARLRGSKRVNA